MISLIAAVSENNVIGVKNSLPWKLPDDLAYFKKITEGHPVIMGWNNYKSMGRALPNRQNIVISWHPEEKIEGCEVVGSLEEAIKLASCHGEATRTIDKIDQSRTAPLIMLRDGFHPPQHDNGCEIFIIGGGATYAEALPLASRFYITRVHATIDGDVFFPDVDWSQWELISEALHEADERHQYAFSFCVYKRKRILE